jgi:hypothetical protein
MTKLKQLNEWLKLAGNLGVFAGLALVALQMQQANHIARAEQGGERDKAYQDLEIGMIGEQGPAAWVKSVMDPAAMTLEQIRVMDAYLINEVIVLRRTGLQEEAGLLPPGSMKERVNDSVLYFFGNEFAQAWWSYERQSQHQRNPEFARYMDEAIAATDIHGTAKFLLNLQADASKIAPVTTESLKH